MVQRTLALLVALLIAATHCSYQQEEALSPTTANQIIDPLKDETLLAETSPEQLAAQANLLPGQLPPGATTSSQ